MPLGPPTEGCFCELPLHLICPSLCQVCSYWFGQVTTVHIQHGCQPCLFLSLITFKFSFLEMGSYCVVQAGLEPIAIVPQLPEG